MNRCADPAVLLALLLGLPFGLPLGLPFGLVSGLVFGLLFVFYWGCIVSGRVRGMCGTVQGREGTDKGSSTYRSCF